MNKSIISRSLIFAGVATVLAGGMAISASGSTAPTYAAADEEQERSLPSFHRIEAAGAYDLTLTIGDTQKVVVTGDKNLERLITEVKNGTLKIRMDEDKRGWFDWNDGDFDITITVPRFTGLELAGAMDGKFTGLSGEDLEVEVAGASDLVMKGSCGSLKLSLAGASDFSGKGLKCEHVKVEMAGAGDASVYASKSVRAEVAGFGDIDVYGNPEKVSKQEAGMADIKIHK